jgi:FkbM family methyltransferase
MQNLHTEGVQPVPYARNTEIIEGTRYCLTLPTSDGRSVFVPFRYLEHGTPAQATTEEVVLSAREQVEILGRLHEYPGLFAAVVDKEEGKIWPALKGRLSEQIAQSEGVYLFGANKIGLMIARLCRKRGVQVKAFLDNDRSKQGKLLDGVPVIALSEVAVGPEMIVVASGRYSNEILAQVKASGWPRAMNLHEFLVALEAPHQAEKQAAEFTSAVLNNSYQFVSAFVQLHDDKSRSVFDGLIRMRIHLDTSIADEFKSNFRDEYLESDYIEEQDIRYYVDGGAYIGDTLDRFEERLRRVEAAHLFEPELPAYYESLGRYADRVEVVSYNFGLTESPSKFTYRPEYSFDPLRTLGGPIPSDLTTFGQGIPLDDVIQGPVSLIKLDIEGAEASALKGAARTIQKHAPKLCVCAYHRGNDLWQLISTVKSIRPEYKVGIRHYSDIFDDTTLYFF